MLDAYEHRTTLRLYVAVQRLARAAVIGGYWTLRSIPSAADST